MLFLKRCSDIFEHRSEEVIKQELAAGKHQADAELSAANPRRYKRDENFWPFFAGHDKRSGHLGDGLAVSAV